MQYKTTVTAIYQKTPSVKSFVLDCGAEPFQFHPGQWVDIHRTINDESHNCGYSITSIPSTDNTIEIAVKLAPDLLLTKYLHEDCKVGDRIYISKAQGDIWINSNIEGPYVFIAGGVGIAPLYSMIRQIMRNKPDTSVTLLYSISKEDEFLFKDELYQLKASNPSFKYFVTVTRDSSHTQNFSGRLSADILSKAGLPEDASYYLCGPPAMVDTMAELLIQLKDQLTVNPGAIYYDKWWA